MEFFNNEVSRQLYFTTTEFNEIVPKRLKYVSNHNVAIIYLDCDIKIISEL